MLIVSLIFVGLLAVFTVVPMNNQGNTQHQKSSSPDDWCDQTPPTYAEVQIQTNNSVELEVNISSQSGSVLYHEVHHLSPKDMLNFDKLVKKHKQVTIRLSLKDGEDLSIDASVEQGIIFNVLNSGEIDITPVTTSGSN